MLEARASDGARAACAKTTDGAQLPTNAATTINAVQTNRRASTHTQGDVIERAGLAAAAVTCSETRVCPLLSFIMRSFESFK
jgi:hypothetical protein